MRAVVDIGSNSIKYLLRSPGGKALPAGVPEMRSWTTGLGRGVSTAGLLSALSIENTRLALSEIHKIFKSLDEPLEIIVVATSAVRDSKNPEVIIELVQKLLGTRLFILSGKDEAYWSHQGAIQAAQKVCPNEQCLFVDIGGASSEISYEDGLGQHRSHSFQAGAVRCHEGLYLGEQEISDDRWGRAVKDIQKFFPSKDWDPLFAGAPTFQRLVAVSGSLVAATKAFGATNHLEIARSLTLTKLSEINETLRVLKPADRVKKYGFDKGRADVLCAGILCVTHIMQRSHIPDLSVTSWGLRHGIMGGWQDFLSQISGKPA